MGKTMRVAMSNGITICAPMTYYKVAAQMAMDEDAGVSSLAGIWTLDDPSAMGKYILAGADLILTNQTRHVARQGREPRQDSRSSRRAGSRARHCGQTGHVRL